MAEAERYSLDTSAIIACFTDEAGADRVGGLLGAAVRGRIEAYASFMTYMEVLGRLGDHDLRGRSLGVGRRGGPRGREREEHGEGQGAQPEDPSHARYRARAAREEISSQAASASGRARSPRWRALGSLAVPARTRPMMPWAIAASRNIAKPT